MWAVNFCSANSMKAGVKDWAAGMLGTVLGKLGSGAGMRALSPAVVAPPRLPLMLVPGLLASFLRKSLTRSMNWARPSSEGMCANNFWHNSSMSLAVPAAVLSSSLAIGPTCSDNKGCNCGMISNFQGLRVLSAVDCCEKWKRELSGAVPLPTCWAAGARWNARMVRSLSSLTGGAPVLARCATRACCNAWWNAMADWKRSAGFLARALCSTASNSLPSVGFFSLGLVGVRFMIWCMTVDEVPTNGRCPVSNWYSTTPAANTSVRPVTDSPQNCSGDI